MLLRLRHTLLAAVALLMTGCIDYGAPELERFDTRTSSGVFVLCEGNFMYGNASLGYYDTATGEMQNNVFFRANGARLGDVAQSMTLHGGVAYVVVNNSGVVYAMNPDTFEVQGIIRGLVSPRYIHFVSDEKAYITDLYAGKITIVNPQTLAVTGAIDTGTHKSTEQMAQWGRYLFVACWSYDDKVLVIDTQTDEIVREIGVGKQPDSVVADCNGKVWSLANGGLSADAQPTLCRIDAATQSVERTFDLPQGSAPSKLCIDAEGRTLYFLNDGVWAMSVDAERLPAEPIVESRGTIYYGLAVDSRTGDIYVADAIDYVQAGVVYRYSRGGELLDSFKAGVIPGSFCFKYAE